MAEVADQDDDGVVMDALIKRRADAERMRYALLKMMHRFEVECSIPSSIPFKEYEQRKCVERPKRSLPSLARANVHLRSYLCLLLGGIRCIHADKGQLRYELRFCTGPCLEAGYEVQINYVENEGFRLIKYNLPHGLSVRKIEESFRPMEERAHVNRFLKLLHNSGCAMLHRKKELENFIKYCTEKNITARTFSSSSARYIEIKLLSDTLRLASKGEFVTFILEYGIDTVLPKDVTFEKAHINQKDERYLQSYAQDFLTLKPVEALRCIRHVKQLPREDALEKLRVSGAKSNLEQKNTASQKISGQMTIGSKHRNISPKQSPVSSQNISQKEAVRTGSKDISPKSTPIHSQKLPGKNTDECTPKLETHNFGPVSSKTKGLEQRLNIFQKSSTPLKNHSADEHQEQLLKIDLEIDDLSSISISDRVQNPPQVQNEDPVAASTPFQRPRTRTEVNKLQEVEQLSQNNLGKSSRFSIERSRQTRLHEFMEIIGTEREKEQEKEEVVRRSPRKNRSIFEHSLILEEAKQNSSTLSIPQTVKTRSIGSELRVILTDVLKDKMSKKTESESEEEADEGKEDGEQKKRKSGIVHKDTPVHKGFRSSRVKRTTVSRSVVTGKRLRRV